MDQVVEVEEMSSDRIMIAYRRAKSVLHLDDVDCDCPVFKREFGEQLSRLLCEDTLDELHTLNAATVADVDADGERLWELATA